MTAEKTMSEGEKANRRNGSRLLVLWALVSGLWTIASLLRVDRVWVPIAGWRGLYDGPWLWLALLLPPTMFAIVLATIHLLGTGPRR